MSNISQESLEYSRSIGASQNSEKSQLFIWSLSQWVLCRLLQVPLFFVCSSIFRLLGYRIENHASIREQFKKVAAESGPLIICSNHLTFIDSMILIWALGSNFWYFRNFSRFSWNLPAGDFFKKKWLFRFLASIGKCIFIYRDGSKDHKDEVLEICRKLLLTGETITFFPEGRRSRSGKFEVERLTHGVGKLVTQLGRCPVLCVYIRGHKQEHYSGYPARGSKFGMELQLLDCRAKDSSKASYHEIMDQVGSTIKAMEDRYFLSRSQK